MGAPVLHDIKKTRLPDLIRPEPVAIIYKSVPATRLSRLPLPDGDRDGALARYAGILCGELPIIDVEDESQINDLFSAARQEFGSVITISSLTARLPGPQLAVYSGARASVVISSMGTDMGPGKQLTYKGTVTLHEDQQTKDWFYPAMADIISPYPAPTAEAALAYLDTPLRVILELVPQKVIRFDGDRIAKASQEGAVSVG